jgi:DNA repair exonuclease SbcCD ATPase subunit
VYLSNTRLFSLLLALAALTLCLLWLLSKQASLQTPTALNATEINQVAAKEPDANLPATSVDNPPTLEPATAAAKAAEQATPATQTAMTPAQAAALKAETDKAASTAHPALPMAEAGKPLAKATEVVTIPENLQLSDKELKALSKKDRERYETMMKNLQSLHDQSTQLSTERQQLEQQMAELERRNQELTKQLEEVRDNKDPSVEAKAKP